MNRFGEERWFVHIEVTHIQTHIHTKKCNKLIFTMIFLLRFFNSGVKGQKAGHASVVNNARKRRVFTGARVSALGECSGGFSPFSLG